MIPAWLHLLALLSLGLGLVCAVVIAVDEIRRPQAMWIMNAVWPVTALFGGGLALWGYWRHGRAADHPHDDGGDPPMLVMAGKAAAHCGSGCTLGDIIAEVLALASPGLLAGFGWPWLFGDKIFAVWVLDFILAFGFGIIFQYCTIQPMRQLPPGPALVAALKADALSLTAWQVGMYSVMAMAQFAVFRPLFGLRVDAAMAEFWFAMQIAMLAGFGTALPVNVWLLKRGIKERM
ncbi:DUF4396 domain-containing protein [Ferrovibrio xuzhouensis]|uniref:DUF4396 domain-containing protein n=1 Tax=Ferrovibrio xuzhouensis TaxID=1576914 RepID=A0ABV7VFR9_9PROT